MLKLILALLVIAVVVIAVRIVTGASISFFFRRHVAPLICAVRGHRRDRASVRKAGDGYHARCRRCDARLAKASRQEAWHEIVGPEIGSTGKQATGEIAVANASYADADNTREERGA